MTYSDEQRLADQRGQLTNPLPAAPLSFTAEELEDLRVALLSAHYSALDEERALRQQLDLDHYQDERHRASTEDARSKAALRAFRYHLLAERVMAQ